MPANVVVRPRLLMSVVILYVTVVPATRGHSSGTQMDMSEKSDWMLRHSISLGEEATALHNELGHKLFELMAELETQVFSACAKHDCYDGDARVVRMVQAVGLTGRESSLVKANDSLALDKEWLNKELDDYRSAARERELQHTRTIDELNTKIDDLNDKARATRATCDGHWMFKKARDR